MRCLSLIWQIGLCLPLASLAQGTFRVGFEQSSYSVPAGGTVTVNVLIDPVPASGLFSFGVQLNSDGSQARVESAAGITVPAPLDFNGAFGPALKSVTPGMAGVKGTVDFSATPPKYYSGGLLATFTVRDLTAAARTSYLLSLGIYRTLGPAESVFVNGAGETLDGEISFGSATVTVIPEPTGALLLLLGGALLAGRRKHNHGR
jgi:hypothetical protein